MCNYSEINRSQHYAHKTLSFMCWFIIRRAKQTVTLLLSLALQPSAGYGLLWLCSPARAMASSSTRFRDHTQRRATVGRTHVYEWSDCRRDLCLQHTTHTTNIHAPGGIRTLDRSRRAAVDQHPRPRGHWDRHLWSIHIEPKHGHRGELLDKCSAIHMTCHHTDTQMERRVRTRSLEGKKAFRVLHYTNIRIGRIVALRETREDNWTQLCFWCILSLCIKVVLLELHRWPNDVISVCLHFP
jgi:hypothetical protein